jgi:hypothetical protein
MTSARTAVLEIMHAIDAVDVDHSAKQKFRQMVSTIAASHGFDWIERAHRIAFARDLLRLRVARPVVRDRLIVLFDISRPQAYRIISHALQLSHD